MTKICPNCKKQNEDTAKFCDGCGNALNQNTEKPKNTGLMEWWNKQGNGVKIGSIVGVCCLGLLIIGGIMAMTAPDKTASTTAAVDNNSSAQPASSASSTPSTDTSSSDSSVTSATAGQEQAAKKAQEYLDSQAFSRSGLIEQLEFEGFTRQQAEYGVRTVGL